MTQVSKDMKTKDLWELTHQRLMSIKEGHNLFGAARMALDELCQRENNADRLCDPAVYGLNNHGTIGKVLADRVREVNSKVGSR